MNNWKVAVDIYLPFDKNEPSYVMDYNFAPLITYYDLYDDLLNLLEDKHHVKGLDDCETRIFLISYDGKRNVEVTNWTTFVLNHDKLQICFSLLDRVTEQKNIKYFVVDFNNTCFISSYEMSDVYDKTLINIANKFKEPLYIYSQIGNRKPTLIDILDSTNYYYDGLVKRMVKRGWFR